MCRNEVAFWSRKRPKAKSPFGETRLFSIIFSITDRIQEPAAMN